MTEVSVTMVAVATTDRPVIIDVCASRLLLYINTLNSNAKSVNHFLSSLEFEAKESQCLLKPAINYTLHITIAGEISETKRTAAHILSIIFSLGWRTKFHYLSPKV